MKFLNPAGLWILLGVPILIIIYLIKAQHEDRAVSSTYIWHLSAKFAKKKLPLQKLKKILLFTMQLLLIVCTAFLVARPYVYNGEICDYVVIIDSSASMRTENEDGVSRFERAVEDISALQDELQNGHTVSIILASDSASYVLQNSTSSSELQRILKNISCGLGECNTEEALSLAQILCDKSSNAEVMFFTDKDFETTENITVVNVNGNEWNASVGSLSYEFQSGSTFFEGTVTSYGKAATLTVGLKVDDSIISAQKLDFADGEAVTVTFTAEGVTDFDYATLYFETEDGLSEDNSYSVCHGNSYTRSVLLVSASPLYLESALNAIGNCEVTTVSSLEEATLSGYSLYIFDGIYPESYPNDGSVILFGSENLPDGLSLGEAITVESTISANTPDSTGISDEITFTDVVLNKYSTLLGNSTWQSVFCAGEDSIAMTKQISRGIYFTVFSFDLHDSNLPMQMDYVIMMKNLINYSAADILGKKDYSVGESVSVYVLPAADLLYIKNPDESVTSLSVDSARNVVIPDEVGIYTAVETIGDGGEYVDFYVHIPSGEWSREAGGALSVTLNNTATEDTSDAISELWFWFALALLLLILAEWGVYYHEQY